ncbi:MAG: carboxypeptidase regulatory-like domain-containing protein [Bryobacteraceae bacterium]
MRFLRSLAVFFSLILLALPMAAQTFRGGLAGSVADASGAAVPSAEVKIVNKGTGLSRTQSTESAGEFNFPDLTAGVYTLTVTKSGFQSHTQDVEVAVGKISSLPVTMGVATQSQTIEIQAAAATLETNSTALNAVVATRAVQEIPLNGRDFTQLLRLTPGYNDAGSMNGARSNQNNWQIDGADNNDFWHNAMAVNQGSISGVAGVLLPIDAIDQFNQQAAGAADFGRNPGSMVNVVIKSGTNSLHGTAYYYNRNEALAAHNPFAPPNSSNPLLRNENYGFSLGGPIWKNRTFFFLTYEKQKFTAGNTAQATVPSSAWIDQSKAVLTQYGVPVNPVMTKVFNLLWPSRIAGAPLAQPNYFSNDPSKYKSDNGIIKIDHAFSEKHTISARAFLGSGDATAFAGSVYQEYFQAVPSRQPNYALQLNSVFTPRVVNQLLVGVNFFQQTFDDADHSQNLPATGFNTGVTNPGDFGAPTISISGFVNGGVGQTPKLGRTDTTGHLTDNLSYNRGSHSLKFGGEVRRTRLDVFYQRSIRGSFPFDGTAGPWKNDGSVSTPTKALADFLAGFIGPEYGSIATGDPQRAYDVTALSGWASDNWQISPRLNINYGVRYDFNGVLHEIENKGISTFLPGSATGFAVIGTDLPKLYPNDYNNFAPRIGFAFTPIRGGKTVIRGGYGLYTDIVNGSYFVDGGAGGERGISRNPVGPTPVFGVVAGPLTIQDGAYIFGSSTPPPPYDAFGVSQDLRTPYTQNFNLNVQQQLSRSTLFQIGYVGSQSRKQTVKRNINQPLPGTTGTLQERRPYNGEYPNIRNISWLETSGNSQYNSLQMSVRTTMTHGLSGQIAYTLAHGRDDMSSARYNQPMNNYDLKGDYGNADFDIRHTVSSYALYDVPNFVKSKPRIGKGWQLNTLFIVRSGFPFTAVTGQNGSLNYGGSERANLSGDPFSGVTQPTNADGNYANGYRIFNPSVFSNPAALTYGNTERNQFHGQSFASLDFSIFKNTPITERLSAQFRVEIFNLTNRLNAGGPDTCVCSGAGMGLTYGTIHSGDAPGIGAGEPRNVQLALKLVW